MIRPQGNHCATPALALIAAMLFWVIVMGAVLVRMGIVQP